MNRDELEQGLLSFQQGKNFSAFADSEPMQTASLSSGLSREVLNLFSKTSSKLVTNKPAREVEKDMTIDEINAAIDSVSKGAQKDTPPVDHNTVSKGINSVNDENDLVRLVETAANFESQNTPRMFKDVQGDMTSVEDALTELEPVFKGKSTGLLTDRQLYGIRSLMKTSVEDAAKYASLIANGNYTPEVLLQYQNSMAAYNVFSKYAKGQSREIARALNSQKIVAKALSSRDVREMDDIIERLTNGTGEGNLIKSAKNFAAAMEKKGALGAAEESVRFNWLDPARAAVEYWKNNILSGWQTHAVNISSVGLTNVWENAVIRPVAATVGAVRQGISGQADNFDRVYFGETAAAAVGSWAGFRGSLSIFANTLKTGESAFGAGKAEYGGAIHKLSQDLGLGKFGEVAADASTISFRLLRAEDDVMRGLAFSQELYALSYRDGVSKGLSGEALLKHMNDLIDNPSEEMYDLAIDKATKITFTNTDNKGMIGAMAQQVRGMVGNNPFLQFIVPFVNTPSNLLQYAVESSALAPFSQKLWKEYAAGGASRDIATAKMITGTGLSLMIWNLYEQGVINGGGHPDSKEARQMLSREGTLPLSIAYDGKTYGVDRMDPFNMSIAFTINMFERAKYAATEEEANAYYVNAILAMSEPAMDSVWMGSVHDFVKAFDGKTEFKNYMANLASGFVPYSGSLKSIKTMMDPIDRAVSKDKFMGDLEYVTAQRIKASLPIFSKYLRPKRYWDGTIIEPEKGGFAYAISPVKTGSAAKGDHINRELFKNGIFPREPSSIINLGGTEFSLLELDPDGQIYDMYITSVGKARRDILSAIADKDKYKTAAEGPNGEKYTMLQRGVEAGKRAGLGYFLKEFEMQLRVHPEWQKSIAMKFGMDPGGFIKLVRQTAALNQGKSFVEQKSKLIPTRKPYEVPPLMK